MKRQVGEGAGKWKRCVRVELGWTGVEVRWASMKVGWVRVEVGEWGGG